MGDSTTRAERRRVSLAEKVDFLRRPEAYPEAPASVQAIETHMAWVFLTDALVYKMRKPVRLPFLDLSSLERRRRCSEDSLRLNRRLAPTVYLDVVPLVQTDDGRLRVGGTGRVTEWLEKMQRLPEEKLLDVAIRRGTVETDDVERAIRVLARFYRDAPPERVAPAAFRDGLRETIESSCRALEAPELGLDRRELAALAARLTAFVDGEHALLDQRIADGRIVEGHGDLRPEHVCLTPEPVFIDCLEFSRELRVVDVADELGYLAMECEFAGAGSLGPVILRTYEQETGDRIPERLIAFYQGMRAMVRAKLSAWHLPDYPPETHAAWLEQTRAYLEIAEQRAQRLSQS